MNDAPKSHQWYSYTAEEVFHKLKTSRIGLQQTEALERLAIFGPNDLRQDHRVSWLDIWLRQFKSVFVVVLIIASGISLALGDTSDGIIILAAVLVNACVGFIQEGKAKQSLAALKREYIRTVRVVRDGKRIEINAVSLAPGDVVVLNRGDRVPADIRLFEVERLFVNESAFTGESEDVEKHIEVIHGKSILPDQKNMVFMGSLVTSGSGSGVVVETGVKTALGHLSSYLTAQEDQTILQQKIRQFAQKLTVLIAIGSVAVFFIGIALGRGFVEMFTTSVAVMISSIPEGLAIVVTIIFAIGMKRIFDVQGLVKTLPAAETLGSATIVCTDKTGTVTTGEMVVKTIITTNHNVADATHSWYESLSSKPKEILHLLELLLLCNDAYEEDREGTRVVVGNMTDRALFQFSRGFGFNQNDLLKRMPRLDSIPFDSGKRYMASLHRGTESNILGLKGSPETILGFCDHVYDGSSVKKLDDTLRLTFDKQHQTMTRDGLRVIAVCSKELPSFVSSLEQYPMNKFVFGGFIGLVDPVREGVGEIIHKLKQAHVKTMLITGDHLHTAQTVAKSIGLSVGPKHTLQGSEIEHLSISELMERLKSVDVCARVVPEDKLKIVEALQQSGHVVAMTGDGVNDAPALQKADIGLALGSGTDVAKEASDIILLNNSFTTIGQILLSGRTITNDIRRVTIFLLSNNFIELIMIVVSFLLGFPALPLIASQILWKNLLSDSIPAVALSSSSHHSLSDVPEFPEAKHAPLLSRSHATFIILASGISAVAGLFLFWLQLSVMKSGIDYSRSVVFAFVTVTALLYVFPTRNFPNPTRIIETMRGTFVRIAFGASFMLILLAFSVPILRTALKLVPLSAHSWVMILTLAILVTMIVELVKKAIVKPTQNNRNSMVVKGTLR